MHSIRYQRGWAWIPAAITAVAGLMGARESRKANQAQQSHNDNMQREFAQQGVSWKVADAERAGIHPLYALGAQTHAYQPIALQDPMGPAMAEAGQNIGRAIEAQMSAPERAAQQARIVAQETRLQELNQAEVDLRRAQTAQIYWEMANRSQPGHAIAPQPGIAEVYGGPGGISAARPGQVKPVPSESVSADPTLPGREAGSTPAMKPYVIGNGRVFDWFNKDWPDIDGPAAWLGNAIAFGGHYGDKFDNMVRDNFPRFYEYLRRHNRMYVPPSKPPARRSKQKGGWTGTW